MSEKNLPSSELPLTTTTANQASPRSLASPILKLASAATLLLCYVGYHHHSTLSYCLPFPSSGSPISSLGKCPAQPAPLKVLNGWDVMSDLSFHPVAAQRLGGAVRIETESFDDAPLDASDPYFHKFTLFEDYLKETFPVLHDMYPVERINEHGLLYTIPGEDSPLKPAVLMAHYDTVPVDRTTLDRWSSPPFSGEMNSTGWIVGRGSSDCKNTLIATLSSVEKLLEENKGWTPKRTVLLQFGFDEEIGGKRGAGPLGRKVLERYGKDGVAFVVDEGFTGIDEAYGQNFARFGTHEKGIFSLSLSVSTLGGHSSVPPVHTGIGILSYLLVELEARQKRMFPPELKEGNPLLSYLHCASEYAEDFPKGIRRVLNKGDKKELKMLGEILAGQDRLLAAWLGTTQAVDMISGGVKVNALPELSTAKINYRVGFTDSIASIISHLSSTLRPIVENKFNMTFVDLVTSPSLNTTAGNNVVKLEMLGAGAIEHAPPTPTEGAVWELLGGTVKGIWEDIVVSTSGMVAGTDTHWTWDLTKHIYRFTPAPMKLTLNAHTVDEMIHIDAHLTTIQFYYNLLRNLESWEEGISA